MQTTRAAMTILILLATLLTILGCSSLTALQPPTTETYAAEMVVTVEGYTTRSRIWARPGLLRMSMEGGRAASGMIARYAEGRCWALMPAAARYQEFALDSLRQRVPHFFDPALELDKTLLGREELDGEPAIKYAAVVSGRGRTYRGVLWEAERLPGYPLRWEDAERHLVASWNDARLVEVPASFFLPPEGYGEQTPPAPDPARREAHCRKR